MSDEPKELSNDELEDISGGKVSIRIPSKRDTLDSSKWHSRVWYAIQNDKGIDSVLEQCTNDTERKFVRSEWDRLYEPGPGYWPTKRV